MHSTPDPSHVRFTGPVTRFASELAEELALLGYTVTSATAQLQFAAHLSGWLESQGIPDQPEGVTSAGQQSCLSLLPPARPDGWRRWPGWRTGL